MPIPTASAPISSPLKVRQRKGRIWAEDVAGQVVVGGARPRDRRRGRRRPKAV